MKFLTVFVIALIAIQAVSASTVADRLKQKITQAPAVESISATSLEGSALSSSAALSASLSASTSSVPTVSSQSASSGSAVSGGCVQQSPCATVTEGGAGGAGLSVQDAVKPVDEWLKDFKTRAGADGADLLKAAKATVSPLIDRLRQNQEHALEKLHDSNEEILHKVEEATTEHIYNILKSQQQKEAKEVAAETKKAELEAVKEEANQKKLEVALAAESSAAVASVSGSSGSKKL